MKEHRCAECNKLLCRSDCIDATIDCTRCKHSNVIRYFTQSALLKLKIVDTMTL